MTDWPGFYFNSKNRCNTSEATLTPTNVLGTLGTSGDGAGYKWKKQYGSMISPPVKGAGFLYQGSFDHIARKIDITNGSTVNSLNLGSNIGAAAYYTAGGVYFPCDDGYLYKLAVADMTQTWRGPVGGIGALIRGAPLVIDGGNKVAFVGRDGRIHALNTADGTAAWTYPTGLAFLALGDVPIAEYGGNCYIPVTDGVLVLNSTTGALVRNMSPRSATGVFTVLSIDTLATGQVLCAVGSADHSVYVFNVVDFTPTGELLVPAGEEIWEDKESGSVVGGPSLNGPDNLVALGTHNWSNQITIADTGYHRWKKDGGSGDGVNSSAIQTMAAWTRPDTNPASSASTLEYQIFPHNDYRVLAWQGVDTPGGHSAIWKYPTTGPDPGNPQFETAPMIVVDAHLYVPTLDGWLYAFGA
jgi:outer membrane protein assembly factor BamB